MWFVNLYTGHSRVIFCFFFANKWLVGQVLYRVRQQYASTVKSSTWLLFPLSPCIFKALRFPVSQGPQTTSMLGYTISLKEFNPVKQTNKKKTFNVHIAHVHEDTLCRFIRKRDEILKEICKITSRRVLLFNIFLIFCCWGGFRGTWVSNILSHF